MHNIRFNREPSELIDTIDVIGRSLCTSLSTISKRINKTQFENIDECIATLRQMRLELAYFNDLPDTHLEKGISPSASDVADEMLRELGLS